MGRPTVLSAAMVERLEPLTHRRIMKSWRNSRSESVLVKRGPELLVALGGQACLGFELVALHGMKIGLSRRTGNANFPLHTGHSKVGSVRIFRSEVELPGSPEESPARVEELNELFAVGRQEHHGFSSTLDITFAPLHLGFNSAFEGNEDVELGIGGIYDVDYYVTAKTIDPDAPLPVFIFKNLN